MDLWELTTESGSVEVKHVEAGKHEEEGEVHFAPTSHLVAYVSTGKFSNLLLNPQDSQSKIFEMSNSSNGEMPSCVSIGGVI